MPKFAPESPSTKELHDTHPVTDEQLAAIAANRLRVSRILGGRSTKLLAIIGPCAMTEDVAITKEENHKLIELTEDNRDIIAAHRAPTWKPRTRDEDWHGLETSDPNAAYALAHQLGTSGANLAIELGDPRHLDRYGHLITLGWKGARNNKHTELTEQMAVHDPTLPVMIKNSLDGSLDDALRDIATIQALRQHEEDGAPAVLLFRGGENAQTPEAWEEQYLRAYDASPNIVVDVAHGGEMAHDPEGNFKKSKIGQKACLNHLTEIVLETGFAPAGVIIEASNAESPTDPVIRFDQALEGATQLARATQQSAVYQQSIQAMS